MTPGSPAGQDSGEKTQKLHKHVRPLQFNYLSYKLFLEKKFCQTPKKRKKKLTLVSYGRKWFGHFLSDSKKKKKSSSFKNIHCKGDSINYRYLSVL